MAQVKFLVFATKSFSYRKSVSVLGPWLSIMQIVQSSCVPRIFFPHHVSLIKVSLCNIYMFRIFKAIFMFITILNFYATL